MRAATLERLAELEARVASRALTRRPTPPLAEWAARYLPSYFPLAPSPFHRWLVGELSTLHTRRGTRLNVLAPRGGAKSTWSTLAYPLWCAVHGLEPYIVITSDTGDQAAEFLRAIRAELESNELLTHDYPHVAGEGPTWRDNRIRLANGVQIDALGTGTKIRGRKNRQSRPTLIINDDPQNLDHILSPLKRERSWEWLTKDVANAGSPQTNLVVLGTALHRECIVCRLPRTPGWISRKFQAVCTWPVRMDLWREWEEILHDYENEGREAEARAFYETNRAEMDRGAVVLWPEREPLYDLMLLRAMIGAGAFGSEKQNDPIDPSACEWPPEYFDRADLWFDKWPESLAVRTIGNDPSKGRDARRGDYSAIVKYGRTRAGVEYVEADLARRPTDAICRDSARAVGEFSPDGFGLEANGFQELLGPQLLEAFKHDNVEVEISLLDNTAPKPVRIRRLTPSLSQRRMRFKARSPGTTLLVQQLRDFPNSDHDDGPDALEMARRVAIEVWNGRQQKGGSRRMQS